MKYGVNFLHLITQYLNKRIIVLIIGYQQTVLRHLYS
jgi:hypothetical protein